MVDTTFKPRINAYWIGWTAESGQAYPQLQNLPAYIDAVTMAFGLVQGGKLQTTCANVQCPDGQPAQGATCLCDTAVDPTHTRENLKSWIKNAKQQSGAKFLLSIGGAAFCDWNSINNPALPEAQRVAAFVNSVTTELALWNDNGIVFDGLDIDYEYPDKCGSILDSGTTVTIENIIRALAEALPSDAIISTPIYGGSPSDLLNSLGNLKDCISYAASMGYGCDMYFYNQYVDQVNMLAMGFNAQSGSGSVDSCLQQNPSLANGMLWNLGNTDTVACLEALNNNLPK